MSDIAFYALLGLGPGAMIGLLALGLVLVYRGTGTLNLGHTSQAALGAYGYYQLCAEGLSPVLALVAATLLAGVSGVVIQGVVMRPLHSASPLTKVIATVGVLIVVQSALLVGFGSESRNAPSALPTRPVELWGERAVGIDRLLLVAIAIVATALLWYLYRRTNFGVATAAVAENPIAAATLGHDSARIAAGNWLLGGMLAGLAGALLVPISGLSLVAFLTLLVPVLAASLGGGLVSFPLTLVSGIAIGVAQAVVSSQTEIRGSGAMVTFALLAILMVLRGVAVPERGFVGARLPAIGSGQVRPVLVAAATALALAGVWTFFSDEWNQSILTSLLLALPLLSVVVITGYAGQLSLAQFALAGVGAYVAAETAIRWDVPFALLLILGGAGAVPVGYVLALAARRMRGVSLAILTLGFSVLLYSTVFTSVDFVTVPKPTLFGIDLGALVDPRPYLTLTMVLVALFGCAVANLRRSHSGRRMIAVRGNERASASIGISVDRVKSTAFMVAAFIAAFGGVLLVFRSTAVSYSNFAVMESVNQLGWAVIGGVGFVGGAIIGTGFAPGGVFNQVIAVVYNDQFSWLPLVGGVLLLVTIVANPSGIGFVVAQLSRPLMNRRSTPAVAPGKPARVPASRPAREALTLRDIEVSFGAVHVLSGVSLTVEPGTVHGLIGPNGAGKTTLLDVVSGFVRPSAGQVSLGDAEITRLAPWRRAAAGIGRSFQSLELFEDLDVRDNIRLASEVGSRTNLARDLIVPSDGPLGSVAWEAIELLGLTGSLDRRISELSNGDRHLVAIARALATDAGVILLDEPAAGLDEVETANLRFLIRALAENHGVAVLLIEHDVDLVMSVSDTVTALNFGRVIASGPPAEVRVDPQVIASYLGVEPEAIQTAPTSREIS